MKRKKITEMFDVGCGIIQVEYSYLPPPTGTVEAGFSGENYASLDLPGVAVCLLIPQGTLAELRKTKEDIFGEILNPHWGTVADYDFRKRVVHYRECDLKLSLNRAQKRVAEAVEALRERYVQRQATIAAAETTNPFPFIDETQPTT